MRRDAEQDSDVAGVLSGRYPSQALDLSIAQARLVFAEFFGDHAAVQPVTDLYDRLQIGPPKSIPVVARPGGGHREKRAMSLLAPERDRHPVRADSMVQRILQQFELFRRRDRQFGPVER